MASEKFDIGKLLRGFNIFNGENFGKILKIIVITIACIILFNFISGMFQKPNVNKPNIKVEKDGNLTYNVIQNEQKRRVEFFGGAGISTDKELNDTRYIGGLGLKW